MRKLLRVMILPIIILLCSPKAHAQEKIITGKILGPSGQPLTGATIKVKGANRAAQTDTSGNYRIQAAEGQTLVITHVGYQTIETKVGKWQTDFSISLKQSDNTLGEVVVTAMDIKRNPRSLGYSAQKLAGTEIQQTQRENFLNSLQGRVAGASINPTGGQAGASTQIVLRGFNSLSLSNQPLFVVDGIIIDNSTMNETSNGGTALGLASDRPNRNNDYTNRIADL